MFDRYAYLYVEDEEFSREVMEMIMTFAMGVRTLTVFSDSSSFIERVRALKPRPEVILLDIHVRPIDGFEMLRLLRAEPGFRDAKILALTASVMNEEVEKLRRSGFNGAVAKPLSLQTFPALMTRVINGEDVWHIV